MTSRPRKRESVANFVCAQIVPKNNYDMVGVNLKTKRNVENTLAVSKGIDRISGSDSANKKQN